jgi:hypothetical protein
MLDTGSNVSLFDKKVETAMTHQRTSKLQIEVANSQWMSGRKDVNMCILDGDHSSREGAVFQHQVTAVDNLSRELFSIDDLYVNHGFNVLLRQPDFESGRSELFRATTIDQPELSIPLRYFLKGMIDLIRLKLKHKLKPSMPPHSSCFDISV